MRTLLRIPEEGHPLKRFLEAVEDVRVLVEADLARLVDLAGSRVNGESSRLKIEADAREILPWEA